MGLLKGENNTINEGTLNSAKKNLFDALYRATEPNWGSNIIDEVRISVYDIMLNSVMTVDEIQFLIDNEYCIERPYEIEYSAMLIDFVSSDSPYYIPNMPKLSTLKFCYNMINNNYAISTDKRLRYIPINCHKQLLSCKISLTQELRNEYYDVYCKDKSNSKGHTWDLFSSGLTSRYNALNETLIASAKNVSAKDVSWPLTYNDKANKANGGTYN